MCLVAFAIDQHPRYRFVLAANRDEFRERPSSQASFWEDAPNILGGRDLKEMGTWLGITRTGRIAFLTNYRDMGSIKESAPTRGHLVSNFLKGAQPAHQYIGNLGTAEEFNGFNLLVGSPDQLHWFSNQGNKKSVINDGIHVVSNAHLDTPWPKAERLKREIERSLIEENGVSENGKKELVESLFEALREDTKAADSHLPDTGIGLEWERILSPAFINTPKYGTVCSTVILVNSEGVAQFQERSFDELGEEKDSVYFQFRIER